MINVRFRFEGLDSLSDRLDRAASRARLASAAVEAVNLVATRAEKSLREGEIRDINLSPAYVKSKTDLVLAQPGGRAARAEIVTRAEPTVLGRFAPLSRVVAPGAKRKAGPILGWRSAGVRVAIRRTRYLFERQWFIMPLRRGTVSGGNGFGVFVRDPRLAPSPRAEREGKYGKRHIYGPAPYQLFKHQIAVQQDDIGADLAQEALRQLGDSLEGSLR